MARRCSASYRFTTWRRRYTKTRASRTGCSRATSRTGPTRKRRSNVASRLKQEDRRPAVEALSVVATPARDAAAVDGFAVEREIRRNAQPRARRQRFARRAQQRDVAIRRFNEDLGAPLRARLLLERTQRIDPRLDLDGQVTVEAEVLAAQARRHQGEQDRRRTHERHDANRVFVGSFDEWRAGIGDAGASGIRKQADVRAGA